MTKFIYYSVRPKTEKHLPKTWWSPEPKKIYYCHYNHNSWSKEEAEAHRDENLPPEVVEYFQALDRYPEHSLHQEARWMKNAKGRVHCWGCWVRPVHPEHLADLLLGKILKSRGEIRLWYVVRYAAAARLYAPGVSYETVGKNPAVGLSGEGVRRALYRFWRLALKHGFRRDLPNQIYDDAADHQQKYRKVLLSLVVPQLVAERTTLVELEDPDGS